MYSSEDEIRQNFRGVLTYFLGKKYWGLPISWVKSTGEYLLPGKKVLGSTFSGEYFLTVTPA